MALAVALARSAARAARHMSQMGAPLPLIGYDLAEGVATLTLQAPTKRNALSSDMMTELSTALLRAEAHDGARVIVLQAAGPVFSAGHDLKELSSVQASANAAAAAAIFQQCRWVRAPTSLPPPPPPGGVIPHASHASARSDLMKQVVRCPVPVIAAVHGIATAAGCQLAASADIVLATRSAQFATPGVNIGLFCSTPAVALTRAVSGKKAAEMLFTGALQTAEEMVAAGLVSRIVDGEATQVQAAAAAMARGIASKPAAVIRLGKRTLLTQTGQSLDNAYGTATSAMCVNLIAEPAAKEGIGAFLEKRHPRWN